jgi:hypothetical protein
MEQTTEPIMSGDLDISVDQVGKRPLTGWPGSDSHGAGGVEVGLVFIKHLPQVRGVNDQDPVKDLSAYAANPAFHDRIRSRRLDRCLDDPDALGLKYRIEASRELGVPVTDHEREPVHPIAEVE